MAVCVTAAFSTGSEAPRWLLTDSLPVYVRIIADTEDESEMQIPDSLYNAIAGSTIFRVNRTELNLNDPWLQEVRDSVLPFANSQELRLVGIDLRGAASPEGPYWNNVRLSKGRAAALREYLSARLDSVADQIWENQTTVAEDYARLLWIMEQRNDPDTELLRGIIDQYGIDDCAAIKKALQRANGGASWKRLLRDIFPELRSARVVLMMQKVHPKCYPPILPTPAEMQEIDIQWQTPTPELAVVTLPKRVKRHMLSVSTNLLYDAFWMPHYGMAPMVNLGLEYYPKSGPWTLKAEFMWPYYHKWSKNKFFQIRDYHLEVRRYFKPGWWHTGPYLAAYVNATKYGIGLSKTKGWQGEGIGGALKAGWVVSLGKGNWRLEFHAAVGGWTSRYDPYVYGNPITKEEDGDYYYDWTGKKQDFKKRNYRFTWFGPTEVGVTLMFDFLYRKVK